MLSCNGECNCAEGAKRAVLCKGQLLLLTAVHWFLYLCPQILPHLLVGASISESGEILF